MSIRIVSTCDNLIWHHAFAHLYDDLHNLLLGHQTSNDFRPTRNEKKYIKGT